MSEKHPIAPTPGPPPAGAPGPERTERPSYHSPLLRAHGALRELTLQSKSGDSAPSDRHRKENIHAVVWA